MFNVSVQKGKHQKYPFQFNKNLFALTFSTRFNQTFKVLKSDEHDVKFEFAFSAYREVSLPAVLTISTRSDR